VDVFGALRGKGKGRKRYGEQYVVVLYVLP
jgi:hypothetical protein